MIITLTTDFGLSDPFVGIMKGVILGIAPSAQLVDISHDIRSYDVVEAAFLIESTYRYFPEGTVHIVVVDPGVGSARRPVDAVPAWDGSPNRNRGVFLSSPSVPHPRQTFQHRNAWRLLPKACDGPVLRFLQIHEQGIRLPRGSYYSFSCHCEEHFLRRSNLHLNRRLLRSARNDILATKSPLAMRGDKQTRVISHLPDVWATNIAYNPPKLAPLERLPKRHRVGPSASLDEYTNYKLLRECITGRRTCQFCRVDLS